MRTLRAMQIIHPKWGRYKCRTRLKAVKRGAINWSKERLQIHLAASYRDTGMYGIGRLSRADVLSINNGFNMLGASVRKATKAIVELGFAMTTEELASVMDISVEEVLDATRR